MDPTPRNWLGASACVVASALLLAAPSNLQAQEDSHTVVRGNTLWHLAEAVYGDPFRWPAIWEANRDRVENPNLIYPGQVLRIPGTDGTVTEVTVATTGAPATGQPRAGEPAAPASRASGAATVGAAMPGRVNATGTSARPESAAWVDPASILPVVPDDVVAAAPFLLPEGESHPPLGRVTGFAGAEEIRAPRSSARLYDRMTYETGATLPAGAWVQAYRPGPVIPGVGRVAYPTGLLEIEPVAAGAPVARVRTQFDALRPGDHLRPVPRAGLTPGVQPVPVTDGARALLVGVARDHELQTVGDYVFLDVGQGDTGVGDEWVPVWPTAGSGFEEGRVQVVSVQDDVATARIVNIVNPVFVPGITMRLHRRMPGR